MNKKKITAIGLMAACVLSIGLVAPFSTHLGRTKASDGSGYLDCDYMETNFTSLPDVLTTCYTTGVTNIEKTWGTVTTIYTQNNYYHAYLQSTSGGRTAGVCLYKAAPTSSACPFSVGDVLYMSGTPTDYNGLLEFDCGAGCIYEIDEDVKGYGVEVYKPSKNELTATPTRDSVQWNQNLQTGPIKVQLENVTLNAKPSNNKVMVTGADYSIELFWGNIGDSSNINTRLTSAFTDNKMVDVIGYMNTYTKNPAKMQIFIRNANDLTLKESSTVLPTSVSIDTSKDTFDIGEEYQFSATVLPTDCTNKNLTWTSSDTSVGIMNGDTFVAVGAGTTVITATCVADGTISDQVTITVQSPSNFIHSLSISIDTDNIVYLEDHWIINVTAGSTDSDFAQFELVYDESCDVDFSVTKSRENGTPAGDDEIEVSKPFESFGDNKLYLIIGYAEGTFEVNITENNSGLSIRFVVFVAKASISTLTGFSFSETNIEITVGEEYYVTVSPIPSEAELPPFYSYADRDTVLEVNNYSSNTIQLIGLSVGNTKVFVETLDYSVSGIFNVTVKASGTTSDSKTIDFTDMSAGTYASNFGRKTIDYVQYGFYRAKSSSGGWSFYPSANLVSSDPNSLPGAFYNDEATRQIESLDITYKGVGVVKYGNTKANLNSTSLSNVSSYTTVNVDVNDTYYWYVEATTSTLQVQKIVVNYTEGGNNFTGSYTAESRENTRISATRYEGTLVDGVSYVDVPTAVSIVGNTYTVTATKRYTYYSFSYVEQHQSELDLDEIALTDPVDVANYYIAFKCAPANFGEKNTISALANDDIGSVSAVNSLFGNKARCLQQYNRNDGYAIGIPYSTASGSSKPTYLEFDFASNSNYSTSSRDVSRVVLWADGWTNTNGEPVATMTDDHYVTFREFNNYGGWNLPFDSKQNGNYTQYRTGYFYGSTTTLVKA